MRPRNPKVQDIEGLAQLLNKAGVDFGVEDVADALWLAGQMGDLSQSDRSKSQEGQNTSSSQLDIREEFIDNDLTDEHANRVQLSLPKGQSQKSGGSVMGTGVPIKAPAAPALRIRLDLSRALRPLRRQVPSPGRLEFDEEATLTQIVDRQIWSPVLKPAPEPWLDVALVVEEMESLPIWTETIAEFQILLERQGAFRQVTTWRLRTQTQKSPQLFPNWRDTSHQRRSQSSKQLWDASGRRLILLLSDCTSEAWHTGSVLSWLETCGRQAPTAVIQLLPERLWPQSALSRGTPLWLSALDPGMATAKLRLQYRTPLLQQLLALGEPKPTKLMTVPVVPLESEPLKQWAKMVAGMGDSRAVGMQFDLEAVKPSSADRNQEQDTELNAVNRVQRFRTTVSLMAQTLAGLMSEAPVSPPIVDLIRQTLLPKAEPVHVAEVFMGGLMQPQASSPAKTGQTSTVQYDFVPGVRELLSYAISKSASESVLNAVSRYISERLGLNTKSFEALLQIDFQGNSVAQEMVIPFAELAVGTLRRMGGEHAVMADQLETAPKVAPSPPMPDPDDRFPLLQTFGFREAILDFEFESIEDPDPAWVEFEFETVTLTLERVKGRKAPQITQQRRRGRGQQRIEKLGQDIDLEMVLIPAGTFEMGSPETEEGRSPSESPQHKVTLASPFLMSKYPITQAQWRSVATLPQAERELNPDPSTFKEDNRPVENIDWYAAVEFCQRLSRYTNQDYRLPSEAEWEYVCRGGSSTPFHYGETITSDLANYNCNNAYGYGPTGKYRARTTDVGNFPANAFGLYDMHGNVWEWCQDIWHENYKRAPDDGSAWISEGDNDYRVLRGGSWYSHPVCFRSAFRLRHVSLTRTEDIGLRVVCGVART
jgi:formylglycine-generating enzyme required for sulfatase activity